ncbi:MAG: thioredoxin family protein [Planctomycetota bacterium]|nr:thioredoxin family protein [Planctomycetota bacterium]
MRNGILAVLAGAVLVLAAGGCAQPKGNMLAVVANEVDFDKKVIGSKTPVLVDFYKEKCPPCVTQEVVLENLQEEFRGRVTFMKFKVREASMARREPKIMERYKLFWAPTMILFVDGKEAARCGIRNEGELREILNKALKEAPSAAGASGGEPTP